MVRDRGLEVVEVGCGELVIVASEFALDERMANGGQDIWVFVLCEESWIQ